MIGDERAALAPLGPHDRRRRSRTRARNARLNGDVEIGASCGRGEVRAVRTRSAAGHAFVIEWQHVAPVYRRIGVSRWTIWRVARIARLRFGEDLRAGSDLGRARVVEVERDQEREDCPLRKHLMVLSTDEAAALLPRAPKHEREGGE